MNKPLPPEVNLGYTMAAGMVVFTFLGYLLDSKLGKGHGATLTGMFLGLMYCGYEVWKLTKKK